MEPYVPLLGSALWVTLIVVGGVVFRSRINGLLVAIQGRIERGSPLGLGPLSLGADPQLRALDNVTPGASPVDKRAGADASDNAMDWSKERDEIYKRNRQIFLAHVITPSIKAGQKYDVSVFLVRHKSSSFADVAHAEFFFGKYWGNNVFRETERNGIIGVSTSAYGPFLCICRVRFTDGAVIRLDRYVDFEMGRVISRV